MQTAHPDLLADILAFCAARGMTKTAFGKAALRDPKFVFELESGERECLPRTVAKVRRYIATGEAVEQRGGA